MEPGVLLGGSIVAAIVAGTIALLAPCCFSVMLPAFFAGSVPNRRRLVGVTAIYALGVATVIVPLALGAVVLRRLLVEEHTLIYVVGGLVMLAMAAHALLGGEMKLPMPSRRPGRPAGPAGVYTLGVFSGVASSCCAPVLAGVVALAGVGGSLPAAAGLGAAYVFGMVAPLFALAAVWDRHGDRVAGWIRPRTYTWSLGGIQRTVTGTGLATGVLLALIGAGMVFTGLSGNTMGSTDGWQGELLLSLQQAGRAVTDALAVVPDWAAAAALVAIAVLIVRTARRQLSADAHPDHVDPTATAAASCCADPKELSRDQQ